MAGPIGGLERTRCATVGVQALEARLEHARGRSAPSRVQRGGGAAGAVDEQHGHAVGRHDADDLPEPGDDAVGFRPLPGARHGDDTRAVDLARDVEDSGCPSTRRPRRPARRGTGRRSRDAGPGRTSTPGVRQHGRSLAGAGRASLSSRAVRRKAARGLRLLDLLVVLALLALLVWLLQLDWRRGGRTPASAPATTQRS